MYTPSIYIHSPDVYRKMRDVLPQRLAHGRVREGEEVRPAAGLGVLEHAAPDVVGIGCDDADEVVVGKIKKTAIVGRGPIGGEQAPAGGDDDPLPLPQIIVDGPLGDLLCERAGDGLEKVVGVEDGGGPFFCVLRNCGLMVYYRTKCGWRGCAAGSGKAPSASSDRLLWRRK